jgi:copper chaperone CopZ
MKNEACAELVREAAVKESAGGGSVLEESIEIDLSERTMVVTYESLRLSSKNIEHAIANAGFTANEIPADPEARAKLPQACK